MKYGNRSFSRKFLASPIVIGILLILCFIVGKAAWNINTKAGIAKERLSQAQAELVELEERKSTLTKKIDYISTAEGIEAELRTKFKAVRDGELVAVIIGDQKAAVSEPNATTTPQRGWFGNVLHFFGIGR